MFYALCQPIERCIEKSLLFGQASISLQHVEKWKYYEVTNLKAKKPKDTRYMNSPIEFMGTTTTKSRGKNCTQLSEVVALEDIY